MHDTFEIIKKPCFGKKSTNRFKENLKRNGDCLEYHGPCSKRQDTFIFTVHGETMSIQKFAWMYYKKEFVPHMYSVSTTCRNKKCVEEKHLFKAKPGKLCSRGFKESLKLNHFLDT